MDEKIDISKFKESTVGLICLECGCFVNSCDYCYSQKKRLTHFKNEDVVYCNSLKEHYCEKCFKEVKENL